MEEGIRGEIIQRAMEAAAVVEGFDVIEDGGGGIPLGVEGEAVVKEFGFEGGEDTLGKGVVVAVTGGTHALNKGVSGQELAA